MKDQRKCMVHVEDKGMFPKVHWMILEDFGGFWKVPSQNASTCTCTCTCRWYFQVFVFAHKSLTYTCKRVSQHDAEAPY